MRFFLRTTLLWLMTAFVGEVAIAPFIAIKGVAPDFTIIALVLLALAAGPASATVVGFLLGLVQDLSNPALLGLRALCKSCLGFGLGSLRGRLVYGMPLVEAVVVVLSVLAHDFVYLLVQSNLTDEGFLRPLFSQSLPVAIYTGLIAVPILRVAEFMGILAQED